MRLIKWTMAATGLLLCALLTAQLPAQTVASNSNITYAVSSHLIFLQPGAVDFKSLLTPPPANDSVQTHDELNWMLELQNTRTPAQIARAKIEVNLNPFLFNNVLGSWFNPDDLPYTSWLLQQAGYDTGAIDSAAKKYFRRPRPYTLDPRLKPCVHLETSASYPSGHSAQSVVWGIILSDMFPERRDAIMARAYQIGDDRVLGGVHFPSDVAAGHVIGFAVAEELLANPQFQADLQKAKQECLADPKFNEMNR
jgi:acid phosphatase (class A)